MVVMMVVVVMVVGVCGLDHIRIRIRLLLFLLLVFGHEPRVLLDLFELSQCIKRRWPN